MNGSPVVEDMGEPSSSSSGSAVLNSDSFPDQGSSEIVQATIDQRNGHEIIDIDLEEELHTADPNRVSQLMKSMANSPDSCPVCLQPFENRSYAGTCFHAFCFQCIREWSKIKTSCPLCKQPFKDIIYNIRSSTDFDEYKPEQAHDGSHGERNRQRSMINNERFHRQELRRTLHERPINSGRVIEQVQRVLDAIRARFQNASREGSSVLAPPPILNTNADVEFRSFVYFVGLQGSLPPSERRVRDATPEFFEQYPAVMHRLQPWINRELYTLCVTSSNVFSTLTIPAIADALYNAVRRHHILSPQFRQLASLYIPEHHVGRFSKELYLFARSPYTMQEFDRCALYDLPPAHDVAPVIVQEPSAGISRSSFDGQPREPFLIFDGPCQSTLKATVASRNMPSRTLSDVQCFQRFFRHLQHFQKTIARTKRTRSLSTLAQVNYNCKVERELWVVLHNAAMNQLISEHLQSRIEFLFHVGHMISNRCVNTGRHTRSKSILDSETACSSHDTDSFSMDQHETGYPKLVPISTVTVSCNELLKAYAVVCRRLNIDASTNGSTNVNQSNMEACCSSSGVVSRRNGGLLELLWGSSGDSTSPRINAPLSMLQSINNGLRSPEVVELNDDTPFFEDRTGTFNAHTAQRISDASTSTLSSDTSATGLVGTQAWLVPRRRSNWDTSSDSDIELLHEVPRRSKPKRRSWSRDGSPDHHPQAANDLEDVSSDSLYRSGGSEVEVLLEMKPRHLRTPPLVDLNTEEEAENPSSCKQEGPREDTTVISCSSTSPMLSETVAHSSKTHRKHKLKRNGNSKHRSGRKKQSRHRHHHSHSSKKSKRSNSDSEIGADYSLVNDLNLDEAISKSNASFSVTYISSSNDTDSDDVPLATFKPKITEKKLLPMPLDFTASMPKKFVPDHSLQLPSTSCKITPTLKSVVVIPTSRAPEINVTASPDNTVSERRVALKLAVCVPDSFNPVASNGSELSLSNFKRSKSV